LFSLKVSSLKFAASKSTLSSRLAESLGDQKPSVTYLSTLDSRKGQRLQLIILTFDMLLVFSFAYLFHRTSHAAPLSALINRDDDQCTFSDQRRSTEDIIWSSLAVIFACTWVSVHPNIPAHDDSQLKVFLRRAGLMFWTLMVPEVVIVWAMREWYAARKFIKEFPSAFDSCDYQ